MDLSGRVAPGGADGRSDERLGPGAGLDLHPGEQGPTVRRGADSGPQPGLLEPGPFEVRWQTAADAGALCWGLYAWANPDVAYGPASPFWAGAPMFEGRIERDAAAAGRAGGGG